MAKAPAVLDVLPPLQQAFVDTEASLNHRLVERAEFVRLLLLCLIGKMNLFALGDPGVGKTYGATLLRDHVDGFPTNGWFWRQLTNHSVPQELFGPPDVIALRDLGRWRHVTENTMVEAWLILLDEIFKANSAILNCMLTFLNERVFQNDVLMPVPFWSVIGTSNEMPQGDELTAMFDRMDVRVEVPRIRSSSGFIKMLEGDDSPVIPTITADQIMQAQTDMRNVVIDAEVHAALLQLKQTLKAEGCEPSDRKFKRTKQIIRAATWMRGAKIATVDDIADARHMLWDTLDERPLINIAVLELASPIDAQAIVLRDDVNGLLDKHDEIFANFSDELERNNKALEVHDKVLRAMQTSTDLRSSYPDARPSPILDDVDANIEMMNSHILLECFGLDPESKKAS